jgi:hypothetical protein
MMPESAPRRQLPVLRAVFAQVRDCEESVTQGCKNLLRSVESLPEGVRVRAADQLLADLYQPGGDHEYSTLE